MKLILKLTMCLAMLTSSSAWAGDKDNSQKQGFALNYDWLNQIVNKTPVRESACPTLDVDVHRNGYRVALETSFYGSVSTAISKWFPKQQIWSAFSIGPMINKFGIIFSDVDNTSQIQAVYNKKLPTTSAKLSKWKVSDSAYWESQGGVAFYLGAGTGLASAGAFAVASGGWTNYLEVTGPNKIYVERSRKNVRSASVSAGVALVSIGAEVAVDSAKGFNYEFNLINSENAEAFDRFMAGDTTKAYELSQIPNSGVVKISDTWSNRFSKSAGVGLSTPILPIISLRSSTGNSYSHEEETSIWDEHVVKDFGIWIRQNSSRYGVLHAKQETLFKGGMSLATTGAEPNSSEVFRFYGNFRHSYQADWGQEDRLDLQVHYAKEIAGMDNDPFTCVRVPEYSSSLGYNQVILQMNLSNEFMKEIVGVGNAGPMFLAGIEARANSINAKARDRAQCDTTGNSSADVCNAPSVSAVFSRIRSSTQAIRDALGNDKNAFAREMANFGKAVWSNPSVFKAFYEKGKHCGVNLNFEVSGQRLSRFVRQANYQYDESCLAN